MYLILVLNANPTTFMTVSSQFKFLQVKILLFEIIVTLEWYSKPRLYYFKSH